jgi:SAM-dependent methyltransferase
VVDQLAKPFSRPGEVTELLTCFGHVVAGLDLLPGMVVLDFGAGTGWTSWRLAQLGCQVIVSDVSAAALDLARERFRRWPNVGARPQPRFLLFDGYRIDLPDASVDRICCFDAFHHLANPADVMAEFARVLRPGGRVAFDEPGHYHSLQGQSQYEIREYGVIEGDIELVEVAKVADTVGMEFVAADVLTVRPVWADLAEFTDLVETRVLSARMQQQLASQIHNKQLFVLRKRGEEARDSRDASGLKATLALRDVRATATDDGILVHVVVDVENTGTATWLPADAIETVGALRLGVRVLSRRAWEHRIELDQTPVPPGMHVPVSGSFLLPADVADIPLSIGPVSEWVAWFENVGSPPLRLRVADYLQPGRFRAYRPDRAALCVGGGLERPSADVGDGTVGQRSGGAARSRRRPAQRLAAQAGPQVIGCRGDQILELVERGASRFDYTVAGDAQCADRFDDCDGVLRDDGVLRGQGAAGGILGIGWIGLAPHPTLPPVRAIHLHHDDLVAAQEPFQPGAITASPLHPDSLHRAEGLQRTGQTGRPRDRTIFSVKEVPQLDLEGDSHGGLLRARSQVTVLRDR